MHVVVTGGAGFIGSNFIRWAIQTQDDVSITNVDALTYAGNLASLADVEGGERYRFVEGDVRDFELMYSVLSDADAVVHFAAESHVDRSIDGPAVFLETNVVGAGVVFDACREAAIENVLHISTDEVYGSIDHGSFDEDDPMRPNSPYATSKAAADLLACSYEITYGFPIKVTRTTNNFGRWHFPEKMIPLFITNLIDGEKLPLYGDGSNVRDWTFVEDNVAAQWKVLTEGEPGGIYNVGAGNELSNLDVMRRILSRFGLGEEMVDRVADRPGHDQRYSVDTARILDLGWAPQVSFDVALDRTIEWYRNNEHWWRPLKESGATQRRGTTAASAHHAD